MAESKVQVAGAEIQVFDEVERARQALTSLDPDDQEYITALDELASELVSRFAHVRNPDDIDEAVSLAKRALELAPPGHSSRLTVLSTTGQALNARYRFRSDPSDMTQAISCFEDALKLCTPEQSFYLALVANLASVLRNRYQTYGNLSDLDQVVEVASTALSASPATSPNRDGLFNNLATTLIQRFEALGNRIDLDTALMYYQSCLDLRPPGHPSRHSVLSNLGDAMLYKFEIEGQLQDLESAANHFASALELRSPGQNGYLICLRNLGVAFWRLFNAQGDIKILEMAISYFETAMEHSVVPNLDHSRLLDNHAAVLQTRHMLFGNIKDLDQAIQYLTTSSEIQPPTYSGRPITLLTLGGALTNRFGETGNIADIDTSVEKLASAAQLTKPGYYQRPVLLSVYAHTLSVRFSSKGDLQDLDLAASTCKEALSLASPKEVTYPSTVANLVVTLMECFHKSGNIDECRAIIGHCDRALVVALPADPASFVLKFTRAKAFSQLFQYGRDKGDINACIEAFRDIIPMLYEGHAEYVPVHLQLGIALGARFQLDGDLKDLDESIATYRVAHRSCKPGNADYVGVCMQLGNALRERFESHQDFGDGLDEAIVLLAEVEEILAPTPGQSDYKSSLVNLSAALFIRFHALRSNSGDLNAAIDYISRALTLPTRSGDFLVPTNLATLLSVRYSEHKDLGDLERSVELFGIAAEQMPPKHLSRGNLCQSYARALFDLGCQKRNLKQIDAAIVILNEALEYLQDLHFGRPTANAFLAKALHERTKLAADRDGICNAINLLEQVIQTLPENSPVLFDIYHTAASLFRSTYGFPGLQDPSIMERCFYYYEKAARYVRFRSAQSFSAAFHWAQLADGFNHSSALLAYQTALASLNQHVLVATSLKSRRAALVDVRWAEEASTLAMDAAACAIAHGELELAVELSEQGRGLLWSQLSQSHTPLDDLRSASDQGQALASDFERVSTQLTQSIVAPSEPLLTNSRVTAEKAARQYRQSSQELEDIITRIRQQEGFHSFLDRPSFEMLKRAALGGPVILVNVSRRRCDALIVLHDAPPRLVPLVDTSLEDLTILSTRLYHTLSTTSRMGEEKMRERDLVVILRALWDTVVHPIVDALSLASIPRGARIWWCPTSTLTSLPLHAAGPYRKGAQNLANVYISSYTPTLAALLRARHSSRPTSPSPPPPPPPSFVAIGQAKPASGSELASVDAELTLVQSLVPSTMPFSALSGDASTGDAVLDALGRHAWAHVACHGFPNAEQPFDAAFALRDRAVSVLDIVRARDATSTRDRSGATTGIADFAFLSACHTTVGDRAAPDETIHLAGALQFTGFRSVVGTLWAVDDGMAREMVRAFYEQMDVLARGQGGDGDVWWDCTMAARALNRASKSVDKSVVSIDQRIVFIHIGA